MKLTNVKVKNKKNFIIFAIIIIGIIAILVLFLSKVVRIEKVKYEISKSAFIYDEQYNPIKLTQEGVITKKWDEKYYLKLADKSQYKLGAGVVVYDSIRAKIDLYGTQYKVYLNSDVEKLIESYEIKNLQEDAIYKLADRKYLIIGSEIRSSNETILTTQYLIIVLDKSGNCLLLNNEINLKTINKMTIQTSTFDFDIANEKLKSGSIELDLKKIIGSTNEYVEIKQGTTEVGSSGTSGGSGENGGGSGGSYTNNNNYNSSNNSNIQVNNNMSKISTNNNNNKEPLLKSISLKNVSVSSTYMDIEYVVTDPENRYQIVYVMIETGGISKTIALDKTSSTYRIIGLEPNTNYKVILGCKEIQEDMSVIENIEDMVNVRTLKVSASLTVVGLMENKIYFNFKMDPNFILDSGRIVLYIDGSKEDEVGINLERAVSAEGWTSSMNLVYGNELKLKLESAIYGGQAIQLDLETKTINY